MKCAGHAAKDWSDVPGWPRLFLDRDHNEQMFGEK
jgi:hypothetical protein